MRRTLHDYSPNASWQVLRGTESAIAGAGAGLVSATVTCPLDVVKTKLQAEGAFGGSSPKYKGLFGTLSRIWAEEGPRGLYRGLGPTIFGFMPTWAIYFTVYDRVKSEISERRGIKHEEDLVSHVVAAMSAGATGTIATNPLWVIKTRFMTQRVGEGEERYRHTGDAIRRIYQAEGIYGFYRGMLPSLFGVTHVAVQFPLYEHFKRVNKPADGSDISPSIILLCSSSSKMIASVVTYPHEVVRTRLQIQKRKPDALARARAARAVLLSPGTRVAAATNYSGVVDICSTIYKEEGIRGFYRGLGVNLVRTVPSSAVTILTYELLIRRLMAKTRPQPAA